MSESQQEIISGIKVYINECYSDYAVMLNGSWGSGKTYFVKNELIPLQNLFVGIVVAVIYYLMTKDISVAIATAGLFAGGTYDIVHNMKKMLCNKDS